MCLKVGLDIALPKLIPIHFPENLGTCFEAISEALGLFSWLSCINMDKEITVKNAFSKKSVKTLRMQ